MYVEKITIEYSVREDSEPEVIDLTDVDIICEELNGSDYIAVPFDGGSADEIMEIGYITLKNVILSEMAEIYISEIKSYLGL